MSNPEKPNRKGIGGTLTHKNPDCKCYGCTARRRKTQALALAVREGGSALESPDVKKVIHADDETLVTLGTGLPADFNARARDVVGRYVALRAMDPSINKTESAKKLGISERSLYRYLTLATKNGWLRFDDPIDRLEHEIIPKTLDNLQRFLDEGDRTVTIEAAKGTIFAAYKASKEVGSSQQPILALKIELAPGADANVSVGGNVFGKPKEIIDAQVIKTIQDQGRPKVQPDPLGEGPNLSEDSHQG